MEQFEATKDENIKFYRDIEAKELRDIMMNADFAITASGQTIYELLAVKTPFIPIKIAENQSNNLNGLKKYYPDLHYIDIDKVDWMYSLIKEFYRMMRYEYRLTFNAYYHKLVDGMGARRIVDRFLG